MKFPTIIVTIILSVLMCTVKAQNATKPQVWVGASTTFGFLDLDPFKLGNGGSLQLNIVKPFNLKYKFGLRFGVTRMGNYNRVYGEYASNILPNGFQYVNRTLSLQSLSFLDAGIFFKHQPKVRSPWSWSIGANASLLAQAGGQYFSQRSISLRDAEISENDNLTHIISSAFSGSGSLDAEDFAAYDFSAEAALYFNITKGCALQASLRQGIRNLIKPTVSPTGNAQHYLTMISLGFSARLR